MYWKCSKPDHGFLALHSGRRNAYPEGETGYVWKSQAASDSVTPTVQRRLWHTKKNHPDGCKHGTAVLIRASVSMNLPAATVMSFHSLESLQFKTPVPVEISCWMELL